MVAIYPYLSYKALARAERAIGSCKTAEQLNVALRYLDLAFEDALQSFKVDRKEMIIVERDELVSLFNIKIAIYAMILNFSISKSRDNSI
jgi:hypothetical protein